MPNSERGRRTYLTKDGQVTRHRPVLAEPFRRWGAAAHLIAMLALKHVLRNRRRTAISLAAVSFGVAALILAGGFVASLLVKLREDTIYSQLGHIQIENPKFAEFGLSQPYTHLLSTDAANFEPIARLAGVRAVMPRLALNGLISVGETTLSFTAQAVDPAKEVLLSRGLAITGGTALHADDQDAVVLGEGLAANLGVKPGDKVVLLVTAANGTFNASELLVRGTFASISKLYDDTGLRMPLAAAHKLLRTNGAQQWLVLLDDTAATGAMREVIRTLLPSKSYSVASWEAGADFYHKTAELFARQFGFLRIVVMGIIVLSILNTMTLNVLERTWEIGMMLALGDSRRQVLGLFAAEGILLGILGSFAGVVCGLGAAWLLNAVGIPMPAPPGMSHGFDMGIAVSAPLLTSAALIGSVAAVLASLPPAIRASRLPVVEALRVGR
jgi:putative ABC transport system permease protein